MSTRLFGVHIQVVSTRRSLPMHAIAPIARVNLNITAFCMNDDSSLAAPPSHSLSGPFFVTQGCKLHAAISR